MNLGLRRFGLLTAALALPLGMTACAGGQESAPTPTTSAEASGDCPVDPVRVTVSVDQWGQIVSQLGGSCAQVDTVLASSSVDPHDYEPSPADANAFEGAQLVVLNGGHYDEWAAKIAAASAPNAPVVNAVEVSGDERADHGDEHEEEHGDEHGEHGEDAHGHGHEQEGNPHVWYDPAAVVKVADAVTAKLSEIAPDAKTYFADRRAGFTASLQPYDDLIDKIKANAAGKSYAATEPVFDYTAAAAGLEDRTPVGYQAAAANESDPSPADLDAFLTLLRQGGVDVLIYNTQTEGSVPQQIRAAAEAANVPVVEVTETLPPNDDSFQDWQVAQLRQLATALGVSG